MGRRSNCAPRARPEVAADSRAQGARDRRRQEHLPADRDRPRARRRAHRRGRQHLPRLDRRDRLPQRRPHQRRRLGRLHAQIDRFLHTDFTWCPTSRTSSWPSGCSPQRRSPAPRRPRSSTRAPRRSRTRSSSRKAGHRPPRRDRVRPRLPRPHADGDVADLEAASVQGRHGAVRGRGLPRAVPVPLPRRRRRRRPPRSTGCADVRHARRGRDRGRDHLRAGAGRGRLRGAPGRVGARPARDRRRARHRADRRRGAVRLRPHRHACSRSSTSASSPT